LVPQSRDGQGGIAATDNISKTIEIAQRIAGHTNETLLSIEKARRVFTKTAEACWDAETWRPYANIGATTIDLALRPDFVTRAILAGFSQTLAAS
jgi:hypothetical protein